MTTTKPLAEVVVDLEARAELAAPVVDLVVLGDLHLDHPNLIRNDQNVGHAQTLIARVQVLHQIEIANGRTVTNEVCKNGEMTNPDEDVVVEGAVEVVAVEGVAAQLSPLLPW